VQDIVGLLKKRLKTDNPHKQWLAVHLVGFVSVFSLAWLALCQLPRSQATCSLIGVVLVITHSQHEWRRCSRTRAGAVALQQCVGHARG
jgi:hypothetical protein